MFSRGDHRRRERSWERDDRDRDRDRERDRDGYGSRGGGGGGRRNRDEKRRSSRSRSPRRGDRDRERDRDRDRDREKRDRRDYDHKRDDVRRDNRKRDRDDKREQPPRKEDKGTSSRDGKYSRDVDMNSKDRAGSRAESGPPPPPPAAAAPAHREPPKDSPISSVRPSVDPNTPDPTYEDGEAMDDINDDEADMMAAMGLSGFGSTKGKHVEDNQEGGANVKRMRTWRQYMNRRGGFNRPLDKIK